MIRRLQRKFVMIAMGSLILVMAIIIGAINAVNLYQMNKRANGILSLLSEFDGMFPDVEVVFEGREAHSPKRDLGFVLTEETPFETRYFIVRADENDNITQTNTDHIAAVSPEEAAAYATDVLRAGRRLGYYEDYKYLAVRKPHGTLVIFLDRRFEMESVAFFIFFSCCIALGSLLVVFVLVWAFSRRAIRPVIESMEKQRQFITDAGHEIKTPLAIISANSEVLEITCGKSEWLDSIRNQTERLNDLVKNLLMLSKMEEEQRPLIFSQFSVSDAVLETAAPFETLAETQRKKFELAVQPGMVLNGNEGSIRQLVSILVDNAVKYANEGGEIRVQLSPTAKGAAKGIVLCVSNTLESIPQGNLNHWFDRFYRADSSRARETGGYGIGLSIAKAVVLAHNGKISIHTQNPSTICFTAVL